MSTVFEWNACTTWWLWLKKTSGWGGLHLLKNTKLLVLIHMSNHAFVQSLFIAYYDISSSVQDTGDKEVNKIISNY